jgi:hypothetical protein
MVGLSISFQLRKAFWYGHQFDFTQFIVYQNTFIWARAFGNRAIKVRSLLGAHELSLLMASHWSDQYRSNSYLRLIDRTQWQDVGRTKGMAQRQWRDWRDSLASSRQFRKRAPYLSDAGNFPMEPMSGTAFSKPGLHL